MTITAAEIFRDYELDGIPSSGAHKPIKVDIREWGSRLEYLTGFSFTEGSVLFANSNGLSSQNNNAFFWDDGHAALSIGFNNPYGVTGGGGLAVAGRTVLIGPVSSSISLPPTIFLVQGGSVGTPQTAYSPMAAFSQVSQIITTGGDGSEQATVQINLNANSSPSVAGTTSMAVGLASKVTMATTGQADIAAGYFFGINNSTETPSPLSRTAFSSYHGAYGAGPHTSAIAIQTGVWNATGSNRPFNSVYDGSQTIMVPFDAVYQSVGGDYLGSAALQVRAAGPGNGQFDTVLGVTAGSAKNSIVRDYSNAVAGWEDHGTHTYGWNGLSATYTTFLASAGFSVDGAGITDVSKLNVIHATDAIAAVVAGATHAFIIEVTSAGASVGMATADGMQFMTNNVTMASVPSNVADWTFGAAGARQGTIALAGSTSGVVKLAAASVTPSGTLTLPSVTDTIAVLGTAQNFTAAQTFSAAVAASSAATGALVISAGGLGVNGDGWFGGNLHLSTTDSYAQIGSFMRLFDVSNAQNCVLANNIKWTGSAWQYLNASTATMLFQANDGIHFYGDVSGSAGAALPLVEQMMIGLGSSTGGGMKVGAPTGGFKGLGTINCAGDIYKNNTAYTNPDFVFEQFYNGSIVKFAANERAQEYKCLMPLSDLRNYTRDNLRLPRIGDDPAGMFERGDIALEKIEESYLYIMELHERIAELEATVH